MTKRNKQSPNCVYAIKNQGLMNDLIYSFKKMKKKESTRLEMFKSMPVHFQKSKPTITSVPELDIASKELSSRIADIKEVLQT
jgi:hypothetical protein